MTVTQKQMDRRVQVYEQITTEPNLHVNSSPGTRNDDGTVRHACVVGWTLEFSGHWEHGKLCLMDTGMGTENTIGIAANELGVTTDTAIAIWGMSNEDAVSTMKDLVEEPVLIPA